MLPNLVKMEDSVFLMETVTSVNVLQPTLDPIVNKVKYIISFLCRKRLFVQNKIRLNFNALPFCVKEITFLCDTLVIL